MEKIKNIRGVLGTVRRKEIRLRGFKKVKNQGQKKSGQEEAQGSREAEPGHLTTREIHIYGLSQYIESQMGGDSGRPEKVRKGPGKFLSGFAISLIKFYQRAISPSLPHTCRFYPTCSNYSIEAIKKYGILKGGLMSIWRILRCNPLNPGGYDPVR